MTEKLQLIKTLLLQGEMLDDIRIKAKTSWRMIYRVIEEHGMQEFRQEVTRRHKSKSSKMLKAPSIAKKTNTSINRLNRQLLGNQVKKQSILDEKVQALNYKNCSDYISQHGAASFKANILGK
jgi:hypothetical protein